jgi:hypothetical protein
MLKNPRRFTWQLELGLIASLALGAVGCGADQVPVDLPSVTAAAALNDGFTAMHEAMGLLHQENQAAGAPDKVAFRAAAQLRLQAALASTERSVTLFPTQEAELLQAFLQIGLGQLTWAHLTLELIDSRYPGKSQDEFLHALLLSLEAGPTAEILADLQESLNDSWSGLGEVTWWSAVEQAPCFAHFRASPEYAQLAALKPSPLAMRAAMALAAATTCQDNITQLRVQWFGVQVLFKHDDVQYLLDAVDAAALISLTLPPGVDVAMGIFFGGEAIAINIADQGCGIVVSNIWLTLIFWPWPQS